MTEPLLRVEGLEVEFARLRRRTRVVHDVSFDIEAGRTLGLVGESGSGKSTIGNAILGLVRPAAGSIRFDGEEIATASPRRRRELARRIQVVFQDPYGSLNPARTVGDTLADGLDRADRRRARSVVAEALEAVGLPPTAAERRPSAFSGGQRQRIAIARALVVRPSLIVCDEAVSALDLSIQAQILNLLADLQRDLGVSYLFISHDLAVVAHVADSIAVLERGRIVESGPTDVVMDDPRHPYTRMLLAAAPVPDPARQATRRIAYREHRRRLLEATAEPIR